MVSLPVSIHSFANDFVSENLFRTKLESSVGILVDIPTGTVSENNRFDENGALAASYDGDINVAVDVYGALDWSPAKYVGVQYKLTESIYAGEVKIYAGFNALQETYDVYASDKLSDLYTESSKVGADVICGDDAVTVAVNKKVLYVAFVCTAYNGNMRVKEFELWSEDESNIPEGFVSENLFKNNIASIEGILYQKSTGTATVNPKFDENGAIAASYDGDTTVHKDVYGWDSDHNVGVVYTLDNVYYCGKVIIYSGIAGYPDKWTVFASDKLEDLYKAENRIGSELTVSTGNVEAEINKSIRYIAFLIETADARVREFELWSAENPDKPFVSENVFQTKLQSAAGVNMFISNGATESSDRFDGNGAIAVSTDGDKSVHADVYGALDWDPARYVGVVYTLNEVVYGGNITIYSGYDTAKDTYRVYASDSMANLYTEENIVADNLVCGDNGASVELNKDVRFVAFFCIDFNGNQRIKEFELWTAQKPQDGGEGGNPDDEDTAVKVLTIGNSFAENASSYATEIAVAQNHNLTFGYIKYPSCTIAQHYENALNDNAVYKFAVTEYNGSVSRTTVKDGSSTFATVKEALEYTDWDIVAIQQGSTASYTYDTYEKADELIGFIKSVCVDAEIMVHETWSWATWAEDSSEENNFKHIEDCYHKLSKDNGNLRIIPTGRAFEFARREGISLNDSDNQHANAYGQYLAGACYTAMIFGADILENVFGDNHPYFADVDMDILRTSVMNAINFSYNPDTNWDWADDNDSGEQGGGSGEGDVEQNQDNFINRHLDSYSEISQDITSGAFSELIRFSAANVDACTLAIDGNTDTYFDVWGALDWEYPRNIGVMYKLNGSFNVKKILIWAGLDGVVTKLDVYASDSVGSLYDTENRVAHNIECKGDKVFIELDKQISCIAFLITDYSGTAHIKEFDLEGSDAPVVKEPIIWPAEPKGENILKKADASKIAVKQGNYNTIEPYEYKLVEGQDETTLSVLTDGNKEIHYDVWSLGENDKPGVLYDLGGYFDITHLHAFAGAFGSELIVNNGYKFYASETFNDLYKTDKLVFDYTNGEDTTNEAGIDLKLKRIRYIAFVLTNSTDGAWRIREFSAYGSKSSDQTQAVEPEEEAEQNIADPNAKNFIKRHFGSVSEIAQNIATGSFTELVRFSSAEKNACQLAIDGDQNSSFEVWGALDWEYPNNIGVMYKLDGSYIIDDILIWAGNKDSVTKLDIYASDSVGTLYSKENKVGSNIECKGSKKTITIKKQISCIAFVITGYNITAHVAEFDLKGSEKAVAKEEIKWPETPNGNNILKNAKASKIIAPGGDFKGSKEFEYRLMSQQDEVKLSVLTDDDLKNHYDVWNLTENDRPGVLYDLGAYYDITHLHAWAGAFESELIVNNGFKIYACENISELFKNENLILDYTNIKDTTNEAAINVSLGRIRYVAFLLTSSSDSAWRMREFAAYGSKSSDQTQAKEQTSIIEGIEAEYYGVATDNLADPIYMGASDYVIALTDGARDSVEFWGGSDVKNSTFVFIYNLYANYDLSGIDIYSFADSIEEDSGIHKGIRSAKVYASRKFDDLFNTKPLVMKEDYADPKLADENSYYSADASADWKGVRYIAYVFTIGDTRYGACRLEELKAFGELSAVQDEEEEEARLPQYIDIKADNGVIARIFAFDATDDLSKLDAHLKSTRSDEAETLKSINEKLMGYNALSLYGVEITDSSGNTVNTGGRLIRLSIPENKENILVACVDDFGAEIVSSGLLGDCVTVETSTLRSYAIVDKIAVSKVLGNGVINGLWVVIIALGALALSSIGVAVIVAVKIRK